MARCFTVRRHPMCAGSLRTGFTLIELLVVIAIMAILAAILFPVFSSAREAARTVGCGSNVRQLAAAVLMYSEDHDEVLPSMRFDRFGTQLQSWMLDVNPYVKNGAIYRCPSDTDGTHDWDGTFADTSISYGYNFMFLNTTPLAAVNKPSETILLLDSIGTFG
jgi:prepilin-type N-terminal cleavage/methylation domain-containing protein